MLPLKSTVGTHPKYVPPKDWYFLTDTGGWAATPGFVVHTRDRPLPFQRVPWRAVVLTPGVKVGAIDALKPSIRWHGQGGASLF